VIKGLYSWIHSKLSRPEERGEYSSGIWQDSVRQQALQWCARAQRRVLEVGCGEGLFLAQLKKMNPGLELWGIDNSAGRIEQARGRITDEGIHLAVGDATRLSFGDGFFDTSACINVFFNMPSFDIVRKALIEMKRVTKRGGGIIFDFRNAANPVIAMKYRLAPFYDRTVRDLPLNTYYMRDIERMLEELGLEIKQKRDIGAMALFGASVIIIEARKI